MQVARTELVLAVKQENDDAYFASSNDMSVASSTQMVSNSQNSSSSSNNSSCKPYTYLCHIAKNTDTVEVVKGCMVSLASKLNHVESVTGRDWQVIITGLNFGRINQLIWIINKKLKRSVFVYYCSFSGLFKVVSIGLFWFYFMPFSYNGVCFRKQHFQSAQSVIVNSNLCFFLSNTAILYLTEL